LIDFRAAALAQRAHTYRGFVNQKGAKTLYGIDYNLRSRSVFNHGIRGKAWEKGQLLRIEKVHSLSAFAREYVQLFGIAPIALWILNFPLLSSMLAASAARQFIIPEG
jgi:hypothetical protein